jgi:two-component system KDP operon response regulator KdpE
MNEAYVLIIDYEPQIRNLLQITMESNAYKVQCAATAKEGLVLSSNHRPDIILLDLGLPDENGQSVLKKLRGWYTKPIIIVSVQSDEKDIINALDNGANDYIIKAFLTGELLARLRTALRLNSDAEDFPVLHFNDLEIDFPSRTVKKNGESIKLTASCATYTRRYCDCWMNAAPQICFKIYCCVNTLPSFCANKDSKEYSVATGVEP